MKQTTTKMKILNAAIEVLGEQGYEGTTTRAIARKAGVNEVTLFRKFGNKEEIFKAATVGIQQQLTQAMKKENIVGGVDFNSDLLKLGMYLMEFLSSKREAVLMLIFEAKRYDVAGETAANVARFILEFLISFIRGYFPEEEMSLEKVKVQAISIMSFIFFRSVVRERVLSGVFKPRDRNDEFKQFIDLFKLGSEMSRKIGESDGRRKND